MMENEIKMVDLKGQYLKIKDEVDAGIQQVIDSTAFINGAIIRRFSDNLSNYMGGCYVVPCANGTDALQIALMALRLKPGDEVIVPAFTYVSSAEVIALLGLTPVLADVDPVTFNLSADRLEAALSPRTKAILPVHLFGQSCDMEPILDFAREHHLYVIEDNAQAVGAAYRFSDGLWAKTGTMGTIGCTSFFPTKNLGCFGDGGAIFCYDAGLAERIRMIANHGQKEKYCHSVIGCNSRLDSVQAAVLDVKLRYLDEYNAARHAAASYYTRRLMAFDPEENSFVTPKSLPVCTHIYHQYTLRIKNGRRDALKAYLAGLGIPSMVYYPRPLQEQEAFKSVSRIAGSLDCSKSCSDTVLSLPMHTELTTDIQDRVIDGICEFFKL